MNPIKNFATHFKPRFWHAGTSMDQAQTLFNYRRFYLISVSLRAFVSIAPMAILLMFTYMLQDTAIENENHLRIVRLTSNTRRTITYFLQERLDALKFIIQQKNVEALKASDELSQVLHNLKMGFGGFVDLGLIDNSGSQIGYSGPFSLIGKNYRDQEWFIRCAEDGSYVSDVFLGYRNLPHMIVALRWPVEGSSAIFILRATLDIQKLIQILSSLELTEKSEAFLCSRDGLLQTPSDYYGEMLGRIDLPVPEYSVHTQVVETVDKTGDPILIGYAYIENSPFILMVVKRSVEIMKGWRSIRQKINWFFGVSVVITMVVVLCISILTMNRIYDADQTRLKAIERLETSSRLISVGRLAAGVAHEINNPLAVIGENAGLIKDLFTLRKEYKGDERLMELIDAVLESVERSGEITKELLGFARQFEPKITPIQLSRVLSEVLSFQRKEAAYRNIDIQVDVPEDIPMIYSDRGRLHQILLNLINNAFQAMKNGGRLDISVKRDGEKTVSIRIRDTGPGISPEDQKRIFEPFFTTRGSEGGIGLGLSITFGLVRKLKGDISVQSKLGEGAIFEIHLPINTQGEI
ncbi:MAG: two-component sensor histidine kinase [Deltaproteobacteria bacterium]|nr:two-component sensor histidine kinase [Deltaproteobacteria bacterium]